MNRLLEEISCTMFPGRIDPRKPVPPLFNKTYQYWKRTWGEVLTAIGNPDALTVENYQRQDILIVLHRKDEVVGAVTSTFFNLATESSLDHPYFKAFSDKILNELRTKKESFVMTSEYLSVHPLFRKSVTGISLSDVLVGMLMRLFKQQKAHMVLGTAIRSQKVHETCFRYGYQENGQFYKYGLDCVLLHNTQETVMEASDPNIRHLINTYWNTALNMSDIEIKQGPNGDWSQVREVA